MGQTLEKDKICGVEYLVGSEELLINMPGVMPGQPFNDNVIDFLDCVSKKILTNRVSRQYPDVVTFAFWIRKGNILNMKKKYYNLEQENVSYVGRGMLFHIAPSNVPVNYAYSLAVGMITGNANVVRIPSKEFPQIDIINRAVEDAFGESEASLRNTVCLIRYGHQKDITDEISRFVDARIIWGGNATIYNIRESSIPPRAMEVTFSDRYSLAVIDSDAYMKIEDKEQAARHFYNDTFLTDQNACTSPRVVIWLGESKEEAKEVFWSQLHLLVEKDYELQPKQAVDKLTCVYMLSQCEHINYKVVEGKDNLITRISVNRLDADLMEYKGNSGFFMEYDCKAIDDLEEICKDTACQTISYLGNISDIKKLLDKGIKGVDRIVPMGQTMDFDLIWDGYNLVEMLTRKISRLFFERKQR